MAKALVKAPDRITNTHRWAGWVACLAVVFLLRVGLFHASRLLEYKPYISLWFPAAGLTFAAFVVFRWRVVPVLIAAPLFTNLTSADPQLWSADLATLIGGGLVYALIHSIAYCLLAAAVLRTIPHSGMPSMSRTINMFLVGGLVAASLAAIGGVMSICTQGGLQCGDMRSLILPWLIGDYTGLLVVGPLMLCLLRKLAAAMRVSTPDALYTLDELMRVNRGIGHYGAKSVLVLGMVIVALLLIAHDRGNQPLLFLVFVAIVLQLWMVHTQTVLQTLLSIAMFSLTLVLIVRWMSLGDVALLLQCATITLAAGSYYGVAIPVLYAHNVKLRRILTYDALTGAYSRHFFVELSEQAIRTSFARSAPVSMMMIDLDYLKSINDRYGHRAGDIALAHVVDVAQTILDPGDFLGRLGGDEFCVMLPGRDNGDAMKIAQHLVEAMRGSRYPFASDIPPGLSIGVVTARPDPSEDYDSLWLRADSALYVAKGRGRNQVASDMEA